MNFKKIWWISLLIKLIIGVITPLANDEAYYWVWSHNLQLSYFDHPPFVAWLFLLGKPLSGFMQAARIPAIIIGHLAILFWRPLVIKYFGESRLILFLFLWLACPLTGLGTILVTPDLPLLVFWSMSIWSIDRAAESPNTKNFLLVGVSAGLAFCAKYHAVLLIPVIVATLLKPFLKIKNRAPLLAALVFGGILTSSPVWVWNLMNDWVSFRFQLNHGFDSGHWKWIFPIEYIGAQVALIFPPVLIWIFRGRLQAPKIFLWTAIIPWLFFLYSSFHARVEANWPAVAFPSAFMLAIAGGIPERVARIFLSVTSGLIILILSQIFFKWIPIKPGSTKIFEFTKFDSLRPAAESPDFFACSYQMASDLSFKLKKPVYKLKGMNRKDFFDFLEESKPKGNRFLLGYDTDDQFPDWIESEGYQIIKRDVVDSRTALLEFSKE